MHFFKLIVVVYILIKVEAVFSQGGPPFFSDDPFTPGKGRWEINLAYSSMLSDASVHEFPMIDLNYGAGEYIQLKIEFPLLVAEVSDGATSFGSGIQKIGAKFRFCEEKSCKVAASFYPQLEFRAFSVFGIKFGFNDDKGSFFLPFEVSKSIGSFKLNAEAGYNYRVDTTDQLIFAFLFGYETDFGAEIVLENFFTAPTGGENSELFINLGLRLKLNLKIKLLAALGRNFLEKRKTYYVYGGIQLNL